MEATFRWKMINRLICWLIGIVFRCFQLKWNEYYNRIALRWTTAIAWLVRERAIQCWFHSRAIFKSLNYIVFRQFLYNVVLTCTHTGSVKVVWWVGAWNVNSKTWFFFQFVKSFSHENANFQKQKHHIHSTDECLIS